MQQTDRIELIKAAAMLTQTLYTGSAWNTSTEVIEAFDIFYDYLQSKLEEIDNDNETLSSV